MGFFSWLTGGSSKRPAKKSLVFQAYGCETPLRFDNYIPTPLGGKTKVVLIWVDITYMVHGQGHIEILKVDLSQGGDIGGLKMNIASKHRGEAWVISSYEPNEHLIAAVQEDLKGKRLPNLLRSKWIAVRGWN